MTISDSVHINSVLELLMNAPILWFGLVWFGVVLHGIVRIW